MDAIEGVKIPLALSIGDMHSSAKANCEITSESILTSVCVLHVANEL